MPYERPGRGEYVTATKVTPHNGACTESGFVGIAVKQKALSWSAGLNLTPSIAIGEKFHIRVKGEKQIANTGLEAATLGQLVYILPADNTLSLTSGGGKLVLGKVTGLPGDAQGCPPLRIRIDLDMKA